MRDAIAKAWGEYLAALDEVDKLRAERDKLYAECLELGMDDDKLLSECRKLYADGDKLRAECDKLYAEVRIALMDAITTEHGNTRVEWDGYRRLLLLDVGAEFCDEREEKA
jgi:uncharacterized coiled-coil DUF342 family protein